MGEVYERLLRAIARNDDEIRFAVRCGSRVYGTATPASDEDFFVVLRDREAKRDLVWVDHMNVVIHGTGAFEAALAEQSVFALECLCTPAEHRLKEATPRFPLEVRRARLFDSVKDRSDSDFKKALKRYDEDPAAARKRVFHALRVLSFARQLLEAGRITDFSAANGWWEELADATELTPQDIERRFGSIREELITQLGALTRR
ncbi:MAG TPA: nucleotidyltransferase domain-containing protein [Polyangiaceae bacterium]|nr:nucleotidyltransferase domain-containing protein [Polyangiaceae bacterium]